MKKRRAIKELTEQEKDFIKDNYLKIPIKRLATIMGYSNSLIIRRLNDWGLVIPKEITEKRKRASSFKKGNIPYNKGKKLEDYVSPESISKIKKSHFKKGSRPHNTIKVEKAIRKRRDKNGNYYLLIKLSDNNWIYYHRYLWEKHKGKIPKGKILIFKDQVTINAYLDNLELISRSEHLIRNREGYYNQPEEIKQVLSLNYKLKDKVRNYENNK